MELRLAFSAHYCQILAVVHKMWLQPKIADIVFPAIIRASESGLMEHALNDLSTRHYRKFLQIVETPPAPFALACIAWFAYSLLAV